MVEVSRLIEPWILVEIEADAVVSDAPGPGIERAAMNDHEAIGLLLAGAGLPVPDARDAPVRFLVARAPDGLAGCAGHERHGDDALLRSVAVREAARGAGLGTELVRGVLRELVADGARAVYLLTTGAAPFFERLGFVTVARDDLPPAVARSREVTDCPACATATCMVRRLG
jgi:amino-acid N-acetyltransferase